MSISTEPTPPLPAERVLAITLTALKEAHDWWYGQDDPKLGGDAFKLRAREVRAHVEQAIAVGEAWTPNP
jgi:hypothetical protein